ncbi:EAL domain-containing protein [Marinibactrum halimedae]|uniref:EAL domain-containing protein n=1 Tax=Marinibactrum halimedae TaxID=1444977 RepID=A0AA37WP63_9GAMM|nr:EAL domain-containing protein [Marinibactrum halimedae]MCD9459491.1 EAL domain-containing protein [Marinibactrum halimedae]GLS28145.1 hypothetical protein GCM10007877_38640 [Marinibactrum halimedae]
MNQRIASIAYQGESVVSISSRTDSSQADMPPSDTQAHLTNSSPKSNTKFDLLQHILDNKTICPIFQPIVDIQNGLVFGYEALTRGPLKSPLYSPIELFKTAYQSKQLPLLESLCSDSSIRKFSQQKLPGLLFLNLSPIALIDFHSRGIHPEHILQEVGQKPETVVLELSEQYPYDDMGILLPILETYRSLGIRIAIDDMGAGYADLQLWSRLKPDFVKIDRYFIDGIHKDPSKELFVKMMVDLSYKMGATLIAEGIELPQELQVIRRLGVKLCQGFLFAKPQGAPPVRIDPSSWGEQRAG